MALVTIKGAAQILRVSERHIRRMIAEKRWPYYVVGRRAIRIDPEEVKGLARLISEGKPENPKEEIRK